MIVYSVRSELKDFMATRDSSSRHLLSNISLRKFGRKRADMPKGEGTKQPNKVGLGDALAEPVGKKAEVE
jgi:hypothetical protein